MKPVTVEKRVGSEIADIYTWNDVGCVGPSRGLLDSFSVVLQPWNNEAAQLPSKPLPLKILSFSFIPFNTLQILSVFLDQLEVSLSKKKFSKYN